MVSLEATFVYGCCLTPPQKNKIGEVSVAMLQHPEPLYAARSVFMYILLLLLH